LLLFASGLGLAASPRLFGHAGVGATAFRSKVVAARLLLVGLEADGELKHAALRGAVTAALCSFVAPILLGLEASRRRPGRMVPPARSPSRRRPSSAKAGAQHGPFSPLPMDHPSGQLDRVKWVRLPRSSQLSATFCGMVTPTGLEPVFSP
jgi:hypothetical protein